MKWELVPIDRVFQKPINLNHIIDQEMSKSTLRKEINKKNIIGKKKVLVFFIIVPGCWQSKIDKKVGHPKSNLKMK
jgi:hypothetical protein